MPALGAGMPPCGTRRSTRRFMNRPALVLAALLAAPLLSSGRCEEPEVRAAVADAPLEFRITFDPALQTEPFTGRLFVVMTQGGGKEPRQRINDWFDPAQVFSADARSVDPKAGGAIDKRARGFPAKFQNLKPGLYQVQAIARRSLDYPVPGKGPGDLYSTAREITIDPTRTGPIALHLDSAVAPKPFTESERVKLLDIRSPLLSEFHGREIRLRAGVILPEGWKSDDSREYPALYVIPGFGGDHHMAHWIASGSGAADGRNDMLRIVPDPTCYRGHSVFADSENNGPWGKALIEELIPAVEQKFRAIKSGSQRYVTGVSSGGWSALWLQTAYPDSFNGCWAHCPDPVDFRDFQRIDLYAPDANMFVDPRGARRPLARMDERVLLYYDDFVHQEEVLGPGGQIHSFEAVFSPRGADGTPKPLFDRATGRIDNAVAGTWEKFDIRLVLERNWNQLAPKLKGKLHVYGGEKDTFYLEGAVALLRDSLTKLGAEADVRVIPGMSHTIYRDAAAPMYRTIIRNAPASARENNE